MAEEVPHRLPQARVRLDVVLAELRGHPVLQCSQDRSTPILMPAQSVFRRQRAARSVGVGAVDLPKRVENVRTGVRELRRRRRYPTRTARHTGATSGAAGLPAITKRCS